MGQAKARGTYAERKANPKGRAPMAEPMRKEGIAAPMETQRVSIRDFVQLTKYVPRPGPARNRPPKGAIILTDKE